MKFVLLSDFNIPPVLCARGTLMVQFVWSAFVKAF